MLWFHSQNKITSKAELALSSSSLTFSASGTTIDLNVITNIPANEVTYEVNSSGVFTVNKNGYTLTISTGNLGTTITPQQSSTITVKARNLTATCTLIRQANVITQTKVIRDNGAEAVSSFLASGGVGVYVCQNTFTSGSKNNGDRGNVDLWSCSLPGAIKKLYTIEGDGVVWKAVSFTIPSKGDVVSDITNFTVTTTDGIGATLNCTQAANKVESLDIRSWEDKTPITSISAIGVADTWYHAYATYTSNTKSRVQGEYSGWSTNASWISLSKTNNTDNAVSVTIGSRGTTPGAARSGTLSFTYGGKASSITLTQAKNYITSLKIGGGSTTSFIPATLTYSAAGGSNPFTGWAVYTTGDQTCITTWAAGDWVLSQSYFSKTLSNGVVTVIGEYRGTTVGSQRTGTLTVNLNSSATENKQLSAQVTLTQAENTKAYGAITISDFHYPEASATANATSSPVIVTSQAVSYDSGAKTTESITGTRSFAISGLSPTYVTLDYSTGVLTWKQNTSGSSRSVIISFTVTANGQNANNSYNASQSTGVKTYSNVTVSLSYSKIPAGGGTVSPTISYSQTWGWNGSTTGGGTITTGGTVTYSGASSSNGAVTAASKGSTLSGVTTVATVTAKVSLNGKEGTATYKVQQAENKYTSVEIRHINDYSSPRLSYEAKGGSDAYTALFTTTAGTSGIETTLVPYSAWSISSTDGFTMSSGSTGGYYVNISAANRGTVLGNARTTVLKVTYSGVSSQITLTQAENTREATSVSGGTLTYSNITAGTITNVTIPAKGGSATATAGKGKQPWQRSQEWTTYTYSSGATKDEVTGLATSGTNDVNPSVASITATATSKGVIVSNQTVVKSQAVTWSANGKSASGTMYIYQQENKVVSTEYAIPVISTFTYPDIPAKGGTVLPTISWSQTVEDTYTSEQSKDRTITTGGTVTYSGASSSNGAVTAASKGSTLSGVTTVATVTAKVSLNGKEGTATYKVQQAENKYTSVEIRHINDYSSPRLSYEAKGGSDAYTALFTTTAGTSGIETTLVPYSAWSISSTDGFTMSSGSTGGYYVNISAANRGTVLGNARTTVLKVTYSGVSSQITLTQAENTREATSVSGGTLTYSNITAGTITNVTIPAKGGSATATAGKGKQPWQRSQEWTTYTYSSGATKDEVTGLATSGTNDVNPSVASITATATSKGVIVSNQTVVKSQAVTWSANGKSASGTMYIYQQENKVVSTEYAIPVISTFTYPDIPAKGGTVLPTISWSQTVEDTYTSEQSKDRTITTGGTVTYSGSAVNPQTGSYTQGTKGTTESARNKCITATVTVVANSRTGTKTTDIYQAANTKTTTYSDVTITTFGYAEAPASGSVLSPTLSYKQTKTDSYTSGSSVPTDITSGASVSYKGGTNTGVDGKVRIPSRGTVEGPRTGIEEVTVTVTLNSKSASSTVTVYQAANEVTSKKISPQDPVPTQETIPATQAGYSYSGRECDLVYKYSSGSSKVAMSIGEPGTSQYGLGVTFSLVDSSGNISASGNYVNFGANTTTSERYAIVNMKFVTNQSDWDSDIYQITITQEAKSGPGTLTIKFLGTAPRIAYYVQMLINGIAVTGPTRYSVQSSINGFTISEGELSYVLDINPGSGNILVNLADSKGGSPSYRAELTQPQAAFLLNGTSISIFANKLA